MTPATKHTKMRGAMMLVDFSRPAGLAGWQIVNDGVMGGLSRSAIRFEGGAARFSGVVSLENNGGFASVRAPIPDKLASGVDAVVVRIRGDGKRYQLRVRMDDRWDGPAYKAEFVAPAGQWREVTLPLASFEATFRGRSVPDAPKLVAERVRQVGFLIAKQAGPFELTVRWIKAGRPSR